MGHLDSRNNPLLKSYTHLITLNVLWNSELSKFTISTPPISSISSVWISMLWWFNFLNNIGLWHMMTYTSQNVLVHMQIARTLSTIMTWHIKTWWYVGNGPNWYYNIHVYESYWYNTLTANYKWVKQDPSHFYLILLKGYCWFFSVKYRESCIKSTL